MVNEANVLHQLVHLCNALVYKAQNLGKGELSSLSLHSRLVNVGLFIPPLKKTSTKCSFIIQYFNERGKDTVATGRMCSVTQLCAIKKLIMLAFSALILFFGFTQPMQLRTAGPN